MNIILIGYMGSGKSSVGRRLAQQLGWEFVDTDQMVEDAESLSIAEIFSIAGERAFRDCEEQALASLEGRRHLVVATGGGIIIRPGNRALLARLGKVVWLDGDPDILFERAVRSGKRPLLKGEDPRTKFDEMLALRRPAYESVFDLRMDVTQHTQQQIAKHIIKGLGLEDSAPRTFGTRED